MINCTTPIFTLQAASFNLAQGAGIYARVIDTNVFGSSIASPSFNGAVILNNPDPPSQLANNLAITSAPVIALTWVAPIVVGGMVMIDYRVSWDQGTGTYVVLI
jgi:hypothetical protein